MLITIINVTLAVLCYLCVGIIIGRYVWKNGFLDVKAADDELCFMIVFLWPLMVISLIVGLPIKYGIDLVLFLLRYNNK